MSVRREPLLTNGSIIALVTAVLALLVSFGIDMSDDQQSAILGVTAAVVPLVLAAVTRPKVTPVIDPRTNTGRRLAPVPADRTAEPARDLGVGGIPLIILVVLAVLFVLFVVVPVLGR